MLTVRLGWSTESATIAFEVEATDAIDNVKAKIQTATGMIPVLLRLHKGRQELADDRMLSDYGVGPHTVIPSFYGSWIGGHHATGRTRARSSYDLVCVTCGI